MAINGFRNAQTILDQNTELNINPRMPIIPAYEFQTKPLLVTYHLLHIKSHIGYIEVILKEYTDVNQE